MLHTDGAARRPLALVAVGATLLAVGATVLFAVNGAPFGAAKHHAGMGPVFKSMSMDLETETALIVSETGLAPGMTFADGSCCQPIEPRSCSAVGGFAHDT